jgi:hypothetical protein
MWNSRDLHATIPQRLPDNLPEFLDVRHLFVRTDILFFSMVRCRDLIP